jgi:septal ring factor EnvC (AmiA/AmiB activator)
MSTPAAPAPQPGAPSPAPAKKPTAWIVATAVLAVVAVGFAVWAFTTKSDLDKANDKVAQQQKALAASGSQAKEAANAATKLEDAQVAEYNRVRRKLKATVKTSKARRTEIDVAQAKLRAAQQQVDEATTREDKLQAQLATVNGQLAVAQACNRGTVAAIDSVFSAPSVTAGIARLNHDLAQLSSDCQETVGGTES